MRWCIVAALLVALAGPAAAGEPAVTLATGDDFPPFADHRLPHGGLMVRIVVRAFEEAGFRVTEVHTLPWKRAYALARQGKVDASFPWSDAEDRREHFLFSNPILTVENYAWVRTTSGYAPTSYHDLLGRRFCRPVGYASLSPLAELELQGVLTRETAGNMADCFRMLAAGRVDFVSANPFDGANAIASTDIADAVVTRLELLLAETEHALIVGRNNPRADAIVSAFNAGLRKLRAHGEIDRLAAMYGLD